MDIIHVSGLPVSLTEYDLNRLFSPFGKVLSARIARDFDGRSLGCGELTMSCKEEVDEILSTKDRISFGGQCPNIWVEKPKDPSENVEVLIRWRCHCMSRASLCSFCKGYGFLEEWVATEQLSRLSAVNYSICGRRTVPKTSPGPE